MQSLKIKNKHPIIKFVSILLALVVLVGMIIGLVLFTAKTGPFSVKSTQNNDPSLPKSDKDLGIKPPTKNDPTSNSVKTHPTPSTPSDISLEITSAQVVGGKLIIRTLLSKLTSEGTCMLTVHNGNQVYTASAGVQAIASSSTCKGFDVPVASLGNGTWNISITYQADDSSAQASKDITVNA